MNKLILSLFFVSISANADLYVTDSEGNAVRDGFGNCVKCESGTQIPECETEYLVLKPDNWVFVLDETNNSHWIEVPDDMIIKSNENFHDDMPVIYANPDFHDDMPVISSFETPHYDIVKEYRNTIILKSEDGLTYYYPKSMNVSLPKKKPVAYNPPVIIDSPCPVHIDTEPSVMDEYGVLFVFLSFLIGILIASICISRKD